MKLYRMDNMHKYKYEKYKLKYLELKNMMGGNNIMNDDNKLKNIINDIVSNFIIASLIDIKCCINNFPNIEPNNKEEENTYLKTTKELLEKYYKLIISDINIIFEREEATDKKKIINASNKKYNFNLQELINKLMNKINDIDTDNFIKKMDTIIWPICESILSHHYQFVYEYNEELYRGSIKNYNLENIIKVEKEKVCIKFNDKSKCCENNINDCITKIGTERIPIFEDLLVKIGDIFEIKIPTKKKKTGIFKIFGSVSEQEKDNKIPNKIKQLKQEIKELMAEYNIVKNELSKHKKIEFTSKVGK